MVREIETFLAAVADAPHLWLAVDARVIAIEVAGRWHNLAARFLLTSEPVDRVPRPRDFPRLDAFQVFQDVYDRDRLPELIAQVAAGELVIQGQRVEFRGSDYNPGEPFAGPYTSFNSRLGSRTPEYFQGAYQYGHALTFTGAHASELYRVFPGEERGLDALLRGLPDPWDGVSDVLLHCLNEVTGIRSHDPRRVAFVAPLSARLTREECLLSDGILVYTVKAASRAAGKSCALVVTGIGVNGRRISGRLLLARRRWLRDLDGYRLCGELKLGGARRVRITLRIGSYEIGDVEVDSRTEQAPFLLSAYHALFPGARDFAGGLFDFDRKKSDEFEQHVALLLVYCGLAVEHLDGPKENDAPDVLAHVPGTSIVLVVEITVGALNQKGKLARLIERTERVRAMLSTSGGNAVPVMVTANLRAAVAENELKDAQDDGIRVLTMEDLGVLLGMALRRAPLRHVAKFLAPQHVGGELPRLWKLRQWHPDADVFEDDM